MNAAEALGVSLVGYLRERAECVLAEQCVHGHTNGACPYSEGSGMTERERQVFVSLVRFVDRHHWPAHNGCHHTPGIDECEPYCQACDLLREVADDVLAEARTGER